MTTGKDEKIELTAAQQNPYLAKPEDFEPVTGDQLEFSGACGDSKSEYARLLKQGKQSDGKRA